MEKFINCENAVKEILNQAFTMSMCLSKEEYYAMNRARRLVAELVANLPAADVVPVRHGRWVFNDELDDMFHCTVCDNVAVRNTFTYCPHCGALMDKNDDEEDEEGNMICTDCYWYAEEQAYCLRLGCHVFEEQDCNLWEPMPKEET